MRRIGLLSACMLLVGSGLLLRSFLKLLDVDLGFAPERVVTVRVDPDRLEFVLTTSSGKSLHFMLDEDANITINNAQAQMDELEVGVGGMTMPPAG